MKQTRLNLGSFHRHHEDNKPIAHNSANAEQPVQETPSTSNTLNENHQEEEDQLNFNLNRKQTVITKVKEKAKKWKQTIARKKSINTDNMNQTPSSGGMLEDYENGEDLDCLEAPSQIDHHENQMQEDYPSSIRIPALGEVDTKNPRSIKSSTSFHKRQASPHHHPLYDHNEECSDHANHKKTLAEAVTEKLSPGYNGIKHELGSKNRNFSSTHELCMSRPLTVTPSTGEDDTNAVDDDVAYGVYQDSGLDKGIREYIKSKLEPGEDERALCQVISKAMSGQMSPSDKGMIEKVKEVVTSLLQAEEEDQEQQHEEEEGEEEEEEEEEEDDEEEEEEEETNSPSTMWNTSSSSPAIPVSTNAYEVADEEESQERVLHAN